MKRARTSSAFTLFELILVMAIIIMIVALAAPSLANFVRGRAVSDTATEVAGVANYCRSRAIVEGKAYRLSIDPNANQCVVSSLVDDGSDTPNFTQAVSAYANPYKLPDGLHIQSDAPVIDQLQVIEFEPSGTCDQARIHITDGYGNSCDVTCATPYDAYQISTGPDAAGARK